ncbi:alpha/beta hydrolase [Desulfovibrio litoralis]|uniref:Lysophospholipase, alpha-beta hydrolase superfamily n=1 Tax=Desulfovibrio litoralis DSM 11393 TaxID=1121455 RepID=A0A1M7S9R6_9BACT|nr:alpha/beta hydrolase [Desulfovibrio litoralis]SHN55221.1 Lysophospholipase, alpha-beta hydrolase superfamily [Desulfovibrio litoralis DSM 11393]
MKRTILISTKRIILFGLFILITLIAIRTYFVLGGPSLQLWHTVIPNEMKETELNKATWNDYLKREEQLFLEVRQKVTEKLPEDQKTPLNRYYENSRIYPPSFNQDWNRSYALNKIENPKGAVVFLHGLTDSPYSLRHIAKRYNEMGFIALGIRLPGHGTVPAALREVDWQDWVAATELAVKEAKSLCRPEAPLHIVGFSNGGALAVKYTLDALENSQMARPDRVILISPMIGITRFARFARIFSLPAFLPMFEKTAWLGIVPEFNPFKFNSFPVNGATQSHRLTMEIQDQILELARKGTLKDIPPILTFQSVVDYTVSTPAIISHLYAHLPPNGSELVLFDVNQATTFASLMRTTFGSALDRILPELPQPYKITVIANAAPHNINVVERTILAGETTEQIRPLDLIYPPQIFSLSHVALPFPMNDPLYGMTPDPETKNEFGINLGTITAHGERGALVISVDSLFRISSNPFFPYLLERIEEKIFITKENVPESLKTQKFANPNPKMSSEEYEKMLDYDDEKLITP